MDVGYLIIGFILLLFGVLLIAIFQEERFDR
jgi:hypothetical protein